MPEVRFPSQTAGAAGEVNSAANVGAGEGIVRDKTGVTINMKSLTGSGGIAVTASGADEVDIDGSSAGPTDTDELPEGAANLYYTEVRVSANTDVAANTAARHTHANKAVLDAISASGSGSVITAGERANLPTTAQKAALDAAATPSGANPFATVDDLPGGTVELWFSPDFSANMGDHRVRTIAGTAAHRFEFYAPFDLDALVALELVLSPSAGAAQAARNIDLSSDYGAVDENYASHSESDTTSTYDFSGRTDTLTALDVSGVFSALAAGDQCGLLVDHQSIGGSVEYYGLRMRYTR